MFWLNIKVKMTTKTKTLTFHTIYVDHHDDYENNVLQDGNGQNDVRKGEKKNDYCYINVNEHLFFFYFKLSHKIVFTINL